VTPAIRGDTLITTSTQLVTGRDNLSIDAAALWFDKLMMRLGQRPWRPLARQWASAIDLRDGRLLWTKSLGVGHHRELNRSGTPIALPDGAVFSSFVLNELIRLNASGGVVWRTRLPGEAAKGNVAISGDSVGVAMSDGRILFVDLASGRTTSSRASSGKIAFFSPTMCDGRLLYPTEDGRLISLDSPSVARPSENCAAAPR
jgi:outer membrane protein assembly factor BamB